MPYSKLKTFAEVVQRGGVHAAAKALGRTASAVSQQLRSVQDEIGVRLFVSRAGRLQLTEPGRLVFELVAKTLPILDQELLLVQRCPDLGGRVTIGVELGLFHRTLSSKLAALQALHPELCLSLHLESRRALESMLKSRKLDFALLLRPLVGDYERSPSPEQVAVVRVPAAGVDDAFRNAPIVMRDPVPDLTQALTRALKERSPPLARARLVVEGLEACKALALRGLGVAALPRVLVAEELAEGTLVEIAPHFAAETTLYWCAHPQCFGTDVVRAVWCFMTARPEGLISSLRAPL